MNYVIENLKQHLIYLTTIYSYCPITIYATITLNLTINVHCSMFFITMTLVRPDMKYSGLSHIYIDPLFIGLYTVDWAIEILTNI